MDGRVLYPAAVRLCIVRNAAASSVWSVGLGVISHRAREAPVDPPFVTDGQTHCTPFAAGGETEENSAALFELIREWP